MKKRYNFEDPVLSKLSILNIQNIKKGNDDTLLPLITSLPQICDPQNTTQLQKIDDQWRKLKHFEDLPESTEIDEFFHKLSQATDYNGELIFPDLCNFVLSVLSLPHSSASWERQFSKVNLIKTKLRNRLITNTVNGHMLSSQQVHLEQDCLNFKPSDKILRSMTDLRAFRKSLIEKELQSIADNLSDFDDDIVDFESKSEGKEEAVEVDCYNSESGQSADEFCEEIDLFVGPNENERFYIGKNEETIWKNTPVNQGKQVNVEELWAKDGTRMMLLRDDAAKSVIQLQNIFVSSSCPSFR
ncbi:unnamed protein product [Psylliodes chrysocephalus]|uniref:HAT C-terminal dimerisation domain-containing protein n=1 Tax=Psylliodes chrysocephalus TaxID=3402493 RepID=A0A9P0GMK1_9CUCU|nr:unnamed protein product [Psylliodes chrysocephala]